jgi:hypothetical protein
VVEDLAVGMAGAHCASLTSRRSPAASCPPARPLSARLRCSPSGLRADLLFGNQESAEGAARFLLRSPDNRIYVENSAMRAEFGGLLEDTPARVPREETGG